MKNFGTRLFAFMTISCLISCSGVRLDESIPDAKNVHSPGVTKQDKFADILTSGLWYFETGGTNPNAFPVKFRRLESGDIRVGYYTIRTVVQGNLYKGYNFRWFPAEVSGSTVKFRDSWKQCGHQHRTTGFYPIEGSREYSLSLVSSTKLRGTGGDITWTTHSKDGSVSVRTARGSSKAILYKN